MKINSIFGGKIMFCPECGKEMSKGAEFCSNCGWSENGKKPKKKNSKFPTNLKKLIKPVLVVLAVVAIGLVIYNVPKLKGKVYNFSEIKKVKPVTKYWKKSFVDNFDTVKFGSYPQNDVTGDIKEPIEWIVLERDGNKALLLSKYILDCKCYNEIRTDATWETCTLRIWLNTVFALLAFDSSEQNKILTTNVVNANNSKYGTNGGNNTNDKVFCLSIDEVEKYFNQADMHCGNKRAVTRGTEYAKVVKNGDNNLYVNDYDDWAFGNSWWWLRSPGDSQKYAAYVGSLGCLSDIGLVVGYHASGVRPALWVSY